MLPHASAPSRARLLLLLVVAALLPVTGALVAAPAHAAPGVVSGVVVDGLGDPLTGVSVTALAAPGYATTVASTTSTTGGEYQVSLGAGTYHLRYDAPGYEQAFYGGDVVVDGAGDVSVGGEPVEGNVLDTISLTSTATHQVSGVVRDADGAALGGLTVQAFAAGDETTVLDAATTAAASGAYVLELRTGVYHLRYTDPSGDHLAAWYDGPGGPVDVAVSADLSLATMSLARPATRFPVAGTVVDALGEPVIGVSVSVTGTGGSTDSGTDTTGPTGTYSVQVLPGTYRVQLAKTGWESTAVGGQATPSTVAVAADGTLSVTPAEVLVGNRLPTVVLRSTPFAVTGAVATADGTALAGVTVRALPEGSTDPDDVVDAATSSTGGSYTLDLPVGAYDLDYVDDDGVRPTYAAGSTTAVHVTQGGALTVDGGPVASLPEKRLALSSADTPHLVVGSVLDVNGDPVAGLTVSAVPDGGEGVVTSTTGRYGLELVPGSYEVEVAGGTDWHDTTYTGEGTATALVTVQLNGTVLVNGVEAVGGELGPTTVAGRTTYALGGSVTDGSSPLAGITVTAHAASDPTVAVATTTTDADGSWTLTGVAGLTVGSYVVGFTGSVDDVGYEPAWFGGATPTPVVLTQGGTATVAGTPVAGNVLPVVTMTRSPASVAHAVVGTLVDANGDSVAGATVTAVPQGGTPGTQQAIDTSGSDGRYRLDVRPGTYRLTYAAIGFTGATSADVVVRLDGVVLVDASPVVSGELRPVTLDDAVGTGSLSGRVADTDARPVAGATVEVLRLVGGSPVATTTTSGTGAWTVSGLRIGTYVLRITAGSTPPVVRGPVKVGQGDRVSVDGVPAADGATGEVVVPAPVVVPPVVEPPVVEPPVVEPPAVQPPVVQPPVLEASRAGAPGIQRPRAGVRGGPSTATVRWDAPGRDGGSDVTSYRVQVLRVTPSGHVTHRTVRLAGPTARAKVLHLAPGTYRFRVCAVTAAGRSPWSALSRRVAAR